MWSSLSHARSAQNGRCSSHHLVFRKGSQPMKHLKRHWTSIFSLLYVVGLVAACAPPLPTLSTARSGLAITGNQRFVGTLRVALTAEPNSLDCPQLSDLNATLVALQL